jgi:hypothetical protein
LRLYFSISLRFDLLIQVKSSTEVTFLKCSLKEILLRSFLHLQKPNEVPQNQNDGNSSWHKHLAKKGKGKDYQLIQKGASLANP